MQPRPDFRRQSLLDELLFPRPVVFVGRCVVFTLVAAAIQILVLQATSGSGDTMIWFYTPGMRLFWLITTRPLPFDVVYGVLGLCFVVTVYSVVFGVIGALIYSAIRHVIRQAPRSRVANLPDGE